MRATAAGLALYALLVLGLHAVHGADILLNALKAVAPGFAAGWLQRSRGLSCGAVAGAALTNALGGAAGEALSRKRDPDRR